MDDAPHEFAPGERNALVAVGSWAQFSARAVGWLLTARPNPGTLTPIFYAVGVNSVAVVCVTGAFIGMVLATQAYGQYHKLGLDTWLGSMVHMSVLRELGPVLAATMLAGRVGSSMAAELGTMRVTEQIDALACLGVDPVHHLVVPRLIACVVLIPLLTTLANLMGIAGAAAICFRVYQIDPHHYWLHSRDLVGQYDLWSGLLKSVVFGAAIALISCHRGFHSRAGSQGVGRAATEAFVVSFIAILALDFFMGLVINAVQERFFALPMVRH